jgi:serine/threonine protein phosphatase PrpC
MISSTCLDQAVCNFSNRYKNYLALVSIFFLFQEQKIDEEFDLLVLASDGLWDVVPNEVNMLTLALSLSDTWKCICMNTCVFSHF